MGCIMPSKRKVVAKEDTEEARVLGELAALGDHKACSNPFDLGDMELRHWWFAGYYDKKRELAEASKNE